MSNICRLHSFRSARVSACRSQEEFMRLLNPERKLGAGKVVALIFSRQHVLAQRTPQQDRALNICVLEVISSLHLYSAGQIRCTKPVQKTSRLSIGSLRTVLQTVESIPTGLREPGEVSLRQVWDRSQFHVSGQRLCECSST